MTIEFDIRRSYKQHLNAPEKLMVCRESTIFLRILGEEPNYEIMTATADEDSTAFTRVGNQPYLIETALRVAAEIGIKTCVRKDHAGREYAKICSFEYISDAFRISDKFFTMYDQFQEFEKRPQNEMQKVYESLAADDSGQDVYLSDGVWLSSDGSVHDRGR